MTTSFRVGVEGPDEGKRLIRVFLSQNDLQSLRFCYEETYAWVSNRRTLSDFYGENCGVPWDMNGCKMVAGTLYDDGSHIFVDGEASTVLPPKRRETLNPSQTVEVGDVVADGILLGEYRHIDESNMWELIPYEPRNQQKYQYPVRIRRWVESEFAPKYVDCVVDELLEAASEGPTTGFQRTALATIFPEWDTSK